MMDRNVHNGARTRSNSSDAKVRLDQFRLLAPVIPRSRGRTCLLISCLHRCFTPRLTCSPAHIWSPLWVIPLGAAGTEKTSGESVNLRGPDPADMFVLSWERARRNDATHRRCGVKSANDGGDRKSLARVYMGNATGIDHCMTTRLQSGEGGSGWGVRAAGAGAVGACGMPTSLCLGFSSSPPSSTLYLLRAPPCATCDRHERLVAKWWESQVARSENGGMECRVEGAVRHPTYPTPTERAGMRHPETRRPRHTSTALWSLRSLWPSALRRREVLEPCLDVFLEPPCWVIFKIFCQFNEVSHPYTLPPRLRVDSERACEHAWQLAAPLFAPFPSALSVMQR